MSSGTPSESETLLASTPDLSSSAKLDAGRDVPVFINDFKRNVYTCKIILGLGLAGSLGVEIWCMIQTFVNNQSHHAGGLHNFMLWEKITNIACVILIVCPILQLIETCSRPALSYYPVLGLIGEAPNLRST